MSPVQEGAQKQSISEMNAHNLHFTASLIRRGGGIRTPATTYVVVALSLKPSPGASPGAEHLRLSGRSPSSL